MHMHTYYRSLVYCILTIIYAAPIAIHWASNTIKVLIKTSFANQVVSQW